ncbi:hypothetical protein THAOC_29309 [Thalassiosira oceanica]|uniref:Uncharacterized protein n=1 Tax=Thalassiosira oceanica TaxID=159749 RepID=K0RCS5_THAOC|nr:hypothetical protein THAOC_29309 [Thalassiosira oceanica]|eukprot:EJK51513.1 hypothetical protein THAOC_29309 [Thalassiosira oceanica]
MSQGWPVLEPASGVRGDDGVYPARPSALYTPTGPLGRSVASVDLKQPSIGHRAAEIIDLSAPMCARLMCDWAVFDFRMAFSNSQRQKKKVRKSDT